MGQASHLLSRRVLSCRRPRGIQKNFVSFAGGGPNTRSTQLFIAFEYLDFLGYASPPLHSPHRARPCPFIPPSPLFLPRCRSHAWCCRKEPWETPFGVAVGPESQATLDALYKGYGEMVPFNKKGIDQQKIQNQVGSLFAFCPG